MIILKYLRSYCMPKPSKHLCCWISSPKLSVSIFFLMLANWIEAQFNPRRKWTAFSWLRHLLSQQLQNFHISWVTLQCWAIFPQCTAASMWASTGACLCFLSSCIHMEIWSDACTDSGYFTVLSTLYCNKFMATYIFIAAMTINTPGTPSGSGTRTQISSSQRPRPQLH